MIDLPLDLRTLLGVYTAKNKPKLKYPAVIPRTAPPFRRSARFFDTVNDPAIGEPVLTPAAFAARLAKASRQIRNYLHFTDVLGIVESCGLEVLVLDQTRPELGLPVAKVIIPGLRHFWPRFAPGRLFESPVNLGWHCQPKLEADMNPVPMFM